MYCVDCCAGPLTVILSRNHPWARLSSNKESKIMSSQPISRSYALKIICFLLVLALRVSGNGAFAQAPAGAGAGTPQLPDSPQPKTETTGMTGAPGKFIGYITNRCLFFLDIAPNPRQLGTGGKFKLLFTY